MFCCICRVQFRLWSSIFTHFSNNLTLVSLYFVKGHSIKTLRPPAVLYRNQFRLISHNLTKRSFEFVTSVIFIRYSTYKHISIRTAFSQFFNAKHASFIYSLNCHLFCFFFFISFCYSFFKFIMFFFSFFLSFFSSYVHLWFVTSSDFFE